jgi:Protein of unknown function (DUF3592)
MKALRTFIYCGVAAVILGIFNVWGILQLYDAARSYNWPHVTGTIISSAAHSKVMRGRHGEFIAHWPDVQYEYVVGDRHFVSDRIMFTHRGFSKSETQRLVDTYPVNKIIAVYFDPRNPDSAVLQPGIWWLFFPILGFAIVLMIVMSWIAYADLRGQLSLQVGMSATVPCVSPGTRRQTSYQYRGVIIFVVAMSFAAIFYKGLLPDAPLWPLVVTIALAVLVLLSRLFAS